MLLELTEWLARDIRAFNVFSYLTLRAVLAAATALLIGLAAGPRVIRRLTELKIGQAVRSDGPQTHLAKTGTPTMGGALILISIAVTTLLWADLSNRFVWVVLIVTIGFGWIGWVDDYRKVVHGNPKGMSAREKYLWQSLIGLAAAFYLAFAIAAPSTDKVLSLMVQWMTNGFAIDLPPRSDLMVPFFKNVAYPLGVFGFVLLSYLVIVGTSNAVNLTDGLDGLAIMPTVMIGSALGVFAYVIGRADFAKYLLFPYIPGAGELVIICGAIAGAGLAFLWFNAYPAEVFMGDVGRARPGRSARNDRRHHAPGNRALHHGWRIRRRDGVGHAAGRLLPVDRRASHLSHGALAPPLRTVGLEGDAGRRAFLDHQHDAGAGGFVHPEAALMARALVLGLGASGLAMVRWLAGRGFTVRVADTRMAPPQLENLRRELDVEFFGGDFAPALLDDVELVALSPGLSPTHSPAARLLKEAKSCKIEVLGEIELFARALAQLRAERAYAPRVIGITGTNGKTTTTRLTGLLIERCGLQVAVAGNIDPPALDELRARVAADTLPAVWVLELSSFQLATTRSLACDAATVLNLSQDHLDWHGTMEQYVAAKARIFTAGTVQILNRDDERVMAMARRGSRLVSFGAGIPDNADSFGLVVDHGVTWLAWCEDTTPPGRRRRTVDALPAPEPELFLQRLMPVEALRIRGRHNAMNALAALALARADRLPDGALPACLARVRRRAPSRRPRRLNRGSRVLRRQQGHQCRRHSRRP